jgi:ribulose-5-phosphate 4-epimerase/fuculose-1-phosphate aldolase
MNASLKTESLPGPAEARRLARIDLAACHRLAARFGLSEGIDNHMTMLVPGYRDRFYLAPFGLHWSELKAGDFMEVDFAGQRVAGDGPIEDTALCIHLPVHRLAPRATCVLHTHMPHATALGMLEDPRLEMAVQSALGFHDDIAYDTEYNGLALGVGEGERMAGVLGDKSVLMLCNHGVLVIGATLAEAFERLYFLERAAQAQILALSTGRRLRRISEAVIAATVEQFKRGSTVGGRERSELHFAALKRLLDRSEPDYAS